MPEKYADYINLLTCDFYVAGAIAGHHSNLFHSEDYASEQSASKAVTSFIRAGVPAENLVMGIPFYGRCWIMKSANNRAINRPVEQVMRGGGYSYIKESLLN